MRIALGLLCTVTAWTPLAPAFAQNAPILSHPLAASPTKGPATSPAPAAPPASAFRKITWDDLMPKDWDPMKEFKDMQMSILSDSDPRANAMLKRIREVWDNAPTNTAMEGAAVRIPGYLVPLEDTKAGMKEFLLVPYFGACIHSPPPPSNQIIHVLPKAPATGLRSMDTVWISGTLRTVRSDTTMGVSSYRMDAVLVEPYSQKER
jgi:uncharacterized protein